jgi:hypothetical protein
VYCNDKVLLRDPNLSFIDYVLDGPAPPVELPGDPAAVAFPGELLGADDDGDRCRGDGFEEVDAFAELLRLSVCLVASFPETTEFPAEKGIDKPLLFEKSLEVRLRKYLYFASGEAADIDDSADGIEEEDLDEILLAPEVCAEGEDRLQIELLMNLGTTTMPRGLTWKRFLSSSMS